VYFWNQDPGPSTGHLWKVASIDVSPQLLHPFGYPVGDDERLVAILHAVGVLKAGAVERGVEGVLGEPQAQVVLGAHHRGHGASGRKKLLAGVDVVGQADPVGVRGRNPLTCHAHLGGLAPAHQLGQEERGAQVGATGAYVDVLGAEEGLETGWLHVCGYDLFFGARPSAPKNRLSGTAAISSRGANALSP
jgi:hypothetical protein